MPLPQRARWGLRLRRRLLRAYEIAMTGVLLGIALGAALPASPGSAAPIAGFCGTVQGSAAATKR